MGKGTHDNSPASLDLERLRNATSSPRDSDRNRPPFDYSLKQFRNILTPWRLSNSWKSGLIGAMLIILTLAGLAVNVPSLRFLWVFTPPVFIMAVALCMSVLRPEASAAIFFGVLFISALLLITACFHGLHMLNELRYFFGTASQINPNNVRPATISTVISGVVISWITLILATALGWNMSVARHDR